jgi:VWFA-related protein
LLVGALAVVSATAQVTGPTERVRVDYVLIDVIALDGKNRSVTDLAREDFVLTENGKKVDLRSFELLDLRSGAAPPAPQTAAAEAAALPPPGDESRYLLALDVEFAGTAERRRAFAQLRTFLEGIEPRRDVSYMLYSFDSGTLSEFERDPAEVARMLGKHERRYTEQRTRTTTRAQATTAGAGGSEDLPELEERFDNCYHHFMDPALGRGDPARYQACVLDELTRFLDLQYVRASRALQELASLADRFPGRERLNTIFLVSPGFSLRPGTAAIELAELYLNPSRLDSDRDEIAAFRDSGSLLPAAPSVEQEFQQVVDRCLRNRVVFHTFDVLNFNREAARRTNGAQPFRRPAALAIHRRYGEELNRGLDELAERSGGVFYSGPNLERMGTLMEVGRVVYTLGYKSPPEGKPFRKIKIKCKRKGVRLLYRPGYYPG